jgi:hypothetical protein
MLIAAAVLAVGVLVVAVALARRTDGISGAVAPPTEPVTTAVSLTTAAPVTAPVTAAPVPSTAAPAGVTPTAVVTVSPLGADGHLRPNLHVTEDLAGGQCTAGGSSLVRGAARCFAGDAVVDPCWPDAASGSGGGVCLNDPFAPDEAVRLSAATGLTGRPGAPDLDRPWGLQLATGELCSQSTGAHSMVGDVVVDYRCGESLVLLRGIDRSSAAWTVYTATCCAAPRPGTTATIRTAWYGGA